MASSKAYEDTGRVATAHPPAGAAEGGRTRPVRRPWRLRLGVAAGLALAVSAGALALGGPPGEDRPAPPAPGADVPLAGAGPDRQVRALQAHLRAQPGDAGSWAALAAGYVEQARVSGDPTRYPQAGTALRRSLRLRPHGNDAALAGRAALEGARHDFRGALRDARRALAVNPYNERALALRVDALVELGRYAEAGRAAAEADERRPGIPVFTRYAYVRELRGDVAGARRVLTQALGTAREPGDIAYVATQLGQLAWSQGAYGTALRHYARALAADPGHLPALEGRGRARAARGDRAGALRDLGAVVRRYPLPSELAALGEQYEAAGRPGKARQQYGLVGAWTALARANGVATDLDTALVQADHGSPAAALRAARAEWRRRHTVHTADALAWALHRTGHDREALARARDAAAPGYRNAAFLYHRGIIERSLGRTSEARRELRAALRLNPGFSPTGARAARAALAGLGGAR